MNKSELVSEIARRSGVPPATVVRVVEAFAAVVEDAVAKGQRVVLSGFGTFERLRRNPRVGRNPHTREAVRIPARMVPSFRPGTKFRNSVAAPRRRARRATKTSRRR